MRTGLSLFLLLALCLVPLSVDASPFDPVVTLWASDAPLESGLAMGESVALEGDTMVAGAWGVGHPTDVGAAYVFVRTGSTWAETQRLDPSDSSQWDFGYSVAMDGDTIVVGAPARGPTHTGAAYVFRRTAGTWSEEQKLVALDGAAGDLFGLDVAISGDTIVVGSMFHDDPTLSTGGVFVFTRTGTTWTEDQKLIPADIGFGDFIGISVDIDGDTIVAGASGDDDKANLAGAAYVFTRTSGIWSEQQKLTASDGDASDQLGICVEISGDTVVAGARFAAATTSTTSGAAYVFTRSGTTWTQVQKLEASDGLANDYFGATMALEGDRLLVGSRSNVTPLSGAAYLFERVATWSEVQKLTSGLIGVEVPSAYGTGLAIDGNRLAVSAPRVSYDRSNTLNGSGIVKILECPDTNAPPTAEAGPDQSIHAGDVVSLDGTGSFDDDTAEVDLGYAWSFVSKPSGSSATLAGADTAYPSFTADVIGAYVVELAVTDEEDAVSAADTVTISSTNLAPVASAGLDRVVAVDEALTLDGTGSDDPEGDAITFAWTIASAPAGSTATLTADTSSTPGFTPDEEGLYVLRLVVNDGLADSAPDDVEVTAIGPLYALEQLACAADHLADLPDLAFDARGHRNTMLNAISRIIRFIQKESYDQALMHLDMLIERTDGCAERGAPDAMGSGQSFAGDYLVDCDDQDLVYGCLFEAHDGITSAAGDGD